MVKKKDPKIVFDFDLWPHICQRIDHYLYKKWPDLFVDENLKEFKKNIQDKYNDMQGKENRINALLKEHESRVKAQVSDIVSKIERDLSSLTAQKDGAALTKKKWWEFWITEQRFMFISTEEKDD